ncbi:13490_t:CDS:1, partial [Rhizophagus irregularis]
LNERNERTVIRCLLTGECTTTVLLTKSIQVNEDIEVSAETIPRVLRKNGSAARAKHKKPLLSKKHRKKRLDFAKRFKDWIVQDWSRVVFKIPNIWL